MANARVVISNQGERVDMKYKKNFGIIAIIALAITSGLVVSGLLTVSKTLSSTGTVKAINVEVYWDSSCTQVVNSIDWGIPGPGDSVSQTVYVKNDGNAPMNVSLSASGWSPVGADTYLGVSWDREGASIAAGEVLQAVITMDVSSSITGISGF